MGHVFYFFGLLMVLLNFFTISRFRRIFELREWMIKFKEVTGRNPVTGDYRKKDDKEILSVWSITVVLTSIWLFFGLIVKSWYVFLSLMIFNTIINLVIKMVGEFSKISFLLSFLKSLILLIVIAFLILNHFHLHLDIWSLIKTL